MTIQRIKPGPRMSGAVVHGNTVYLAGQVANQSAVAYCAQRYRSYDPASGTYLGYDGLRHPCP